MTGEMSAPVDEDVWGHHATIRDIVDGELKPFDQYQGPYIQCPNGHSLWLIVDTGDDCSCHIKGYYVYNENTEETSDTLPVPYSNGVSTRVMLEEMVRQVYPLDKSVKA